jgi:hypothetical protein
MKRSDRLIGTDQNLLINLNKNLIIVFYDILLWDDIVYLRKLYDNRYYRFEFFICRVSDRADIINREIVNYSSSEVLRLFNKVFI